VGWFILILLLIAAALGVLGEVLEVAVMLVLGTLLAVVIVIWGGWWYLRYRMRRFIRDVDRELDRQDRRGRAYPAEGSVPGAEDRGERDLPG
jgi:hypothetical protein